jgi:hypothetical protein
MAVQTSVIMVFTARILLTRFVTLPAASQAPQNIDKDDVKVEYFRIARLVGAPYNYV